MSVVHFNDNANVSPVGSVTHSVHSSQFFTKVRTPEPLEEVEHEIIDAKQKAEGSVWDGSSVIDDELEVEEGATVDEMKIQTMFKMVDDIPVTIQGQQVVKKVLYLTNKQAALFDDAAMERCIQALDIGDPKFVIKLTNSCGIEAQMRKAHGEMLGTPKAEYLGNSFLSSELDKSDERIIETQMILFMRTCILPLAIQTRAIILVGGANDCSLSAALSNVALSEQARLGKDCPFTVIATVLEFKVHSKAVMSRNSHTLSAQLSRGCRAWRRRLPAMSKILTKLKNEKLEECDVTAAASRYIVFEAFDEEEGHRPRKNLGPKSKFEATFISSLTRKLPSICIQTHNIFFGVPYLSELVARNIPVLFIDSVERAITMRRVVGEQKNMLTRQAKETNAFPLLSIDQVDKVKIHSDGVSLEGRMELLNIAQEMLEEKWEVFTKNRVVDVLDASLLAFIHSTLRLGGEMDDSSSLGENGNSLYSRIRELEKLERTNKDSKKALFPPELATKAVNIIQIKDQALSQFARLAKVEAWLLNHDASVDHLVDDATEYRDKLKAICASIEANGGTDKSVTIEPDVWLATYDILTSPNTYSGSIHDIDDLKRILASVAKIDRLPASNSLETLRILQDGWDHVEVYQQAADSYKTAAKVSYKLMLICGILIALIALLDVTGCGVVDVNSRVPIMILSFIETAIAAYITFTNPGLRWQQLREASVSIESHIWTFRTRSGLYRCDTLEMSAEAALCTTIADIKANVLEGADIKSTAFYSRATSRNLHGQHATPNAGFGRLDSYNHNGTKKKMHRQSWFSYVCSCCKRSEKPNLVLPHHHVPKHFNEFVTTFGDSNRGNESNKSTSNDNLTLVPGQLVHQQSILRPDNTVSLEDLVAKLRNDPDNEMADTVDTHYEPLHPDSYIRYRVMAALSFYKKRIPKANRTRNIAQVLLVLGSIGSGAVAFAGIPVWGSIVSTLSLAITAYLEFQGTNSKIMRYSSTVHALQEITMWWQTLPRIERSVVSNVDRLVLSCEELLQREQQAWKATSQVVRMLQKKGKEESENNDKNA